MRTRKKLLTCLLAALLSLTAMACESQESGGDPLEDGAGTQQDAGEDDDGGY